MHARTPIRAHVWHARTHAWKRAGTDAARETRIPARAQHTHTHTHARGVPQGALDSATVGDEQRSAAARILSEAGAAIVSVRSIGMTHIVKYKHYERCKRCKPAAARYLKAHPREHPSPGALRAAARARAGGRVSVGTLCEVVVAPLVACGVDAASFRTRKAAALGISKVRCSAAVNPSTLVARSLGTVGLLRGALSGGVGVLARGALSKGTKPAGDESQCAGLVITKSVPVRVPVLGNGRAAAFGVAPLGKPAL
jgi:hypothetical protein